VPPTPSAGHDRQAGPHRRVRRPAGADLRLDERDARKLDLDKHLAGAGNRVGHVGGDEQLGRAELV
jgi:hypothetical protein